MSTPQNIVYLDTPTGPPNYISIPATQKFQISNQSLTLMLWVRLDFNDSSLTTGKKFLFGTDSFGLLISEGKYVWGSLTTNVTASANVPAGDDATWVHLCGQYDNSSKQWSLRRNSHIIATTSGRGPLGTDPTWYLGGRPIQTATSSGVQLSGAWLFASTISDTKLRTLYMAYVAKSPPESSEDVLIGYWPMSDGSGSTAMDCSDYAPQANGIFMMGGIQWITTAWQSNFAFVDFDGEISVTVQTIQDASASNPYNIYISHGDFTQQVVLKPWINLVGAGQGLTAIDVMATSASPIGSLVLANNVKIRQLEILSTAVSDDSSVCAIEAPENTIVATLNNVTIYANGKSYRNVVKGLSILKASSSSEIICDRCVFQTTGGIADTVIVNQKANLELAGCVIQSLSGPNSASVGVTTNQSQVKILNSQISSSNIAIYAQIDSQVDLQRCQVLGQNGSLFTSSNGAITATQCEITGRVQGNVTIN